VTGSNAKTLRLQQLQQRLGYTFTDVGLLNLALTHRSAGKHNNERLEFLGDSLVNHVVAEHLYRHFTSASEGQLSRLRAKLVRGTYLAKLAVNFELGECLVLGSGERKSGGRHRDSILADALEAIAGAMLLDSNYTTANRVVSRWFESSLDALELSDERDAKTRLQEWLQGKGYPLPEYALASIAGADHDQHFTVRCSVAPLSEVIQGTGKSRRAAEQAAAARVLEALQND
jgi:ribonuclease-3